MFRLGRLGWKYRLGLRLSQSDVSVLQKGFNALFCEICVDLLGHKDGAVASTGAAKRDLEVVSICVLELSDGKEQQGPDVVEEGIGALLFSQVVSDFWILSTFGAQLGDPVGIGEKAHIKQHIHVERDTVLKAK
jgi:hypothetical protein